MADPRITFTRGRYLLDGQPLPRVTSILAVLDKNLLDWIRRVGWEEADRARNDGTSLGTAVHKAFEAVNRGKKPNTAGPRGIDLTPYVERYIGWRDTYVARVVAQEQPVYHEVHRYAGTPDLIVELHDGRTALVDFKTNKSVDGHWGLQLAAYAGALESMGQPVNGRMVLHFPSGDEGRMLRLYDYRDDEQHDRAWRACVRAYRYVTAHKNDWRDLRGIEL